MSDVAVSNIAMNDCLDFYLTEGREQVHALPQLAALKEAALNDFSIRGFPAPRDEEWKYTTTASFTAQRFKRQAYPVDASISVTDCPLDVNGVLPKGVIFQSWPEALATNWDKIEPYLNQIIENTHGFHVQNMLMLNDGFFVYVPKGVQLEKPLLLSYRQSQAEQARYIRTLIVLESDSSATILEDYQGTTNAAYYTNAVTEVSLSTNAMLNHYKIQRESNAAYHVSELAVKQQAHSQLASHSVSLGGKWVRSDTSITLAEPHAACLMNGIYAPQHGQHVDHHTRVNHHVPNCQSHQDYKGLMMGQSRGVFNGKVFVACDAQQTEATQQNKNILLSPHAEIDTKPQLEIFANDVVCSHGATVGQLDEDALFYLGARGIERDEASRYLVQAFIVDNIRKMTSEPIAQWMSGLLMQHVVKGI